MRAPQISLNELGARFGEMLALVDRSVAIGAADAKAAAYARVLEYGSVAGERPWPRPGERTVAAVDPDSGEQVVVSAQAPQGFIRVRAPEFLDQLREAIAAPANWLDAEYLDRHFAAATRAAAAQALEAMRAAVPRDTGQLGQSLTVLND